MSVQPNHTMNITKLLAASSLVLLSSAFGDEPVVPSGFLDVSALLVLENSDVDLNWEVNIPASKVEELIDIPEDEPTIIAKEDVAFDVRVLGVEYAWMGQYVLAQASYRYADSPNYTFFRGYGDDVNSLTNKTCDILRTGEELQFRFRGTKNGFRFMPWQHRQWFSHRHSSGERGTLILKNGDQLPDRATPSSQVDIASFLAPYLTDDLKTIQIGPKDLIVLAELNRDIDDEYADYQDMVILVTFTEADNSECTRRWAGPPPPAPPVDTPAPADSPTPGPVVVTPPVIPEKPEVPGLPE